ncbi:condensation domain-containing protein [Amycolatopsis sp. NPDC005232]|uniref:condensation domain-containing protein n=1 Tax=Amycolatopsis sp. NPDC005232 TaxID=3157027 RepID=UPI0033A1CF3C
MSGDQTDLAARAERERELLAVLGRRIDRIPVLRRENGGLRAPASPTQRHFHALQQRHPGQAGFTMSGGLRLTGPLDVIALDRAVAEVVARHEALRTVFETHDGRLFQIVLPEARLPVPVRDVTEQDALGVAKTFSDTPPDLGREGPLRMSVLRLAELDHIVLFALHHIVGDLRSVEVFFQELYVLYRSGLTGAAAETAGLLAPLTAQLADVTEWQRGAVSTARKAELETYWRTRMAGVEPLTLPADAVRVSPPSTTGDTCRLPMADELVATLNRLAADHGCTIFTLSHAVFALLLARYSGPNVVVSTPVTSRDRPEVDKLVGANLNYVPLHTHVDDGLTFGAYLNASRDRTTADLAHDDLPYQDIAALAGLPPIELYRVLFQSGGGGDIEFPEGDLSGTPWPAPWDHSMNDLTARVTSAAAGWYLYLNFRCDVFTRERMTALGVEYLDLLAGAAADPDVLVADLITPKRRS